MNRAYHRNGRILGVIIAACSGLGVACSAGTDSRKPETKDPSASIYTTADGEYHLISTVNDPVLVGRWRFNEGTVLLPNTQLLFDSSNNDNTGFRGSTIGSDANDPARTAFGTGNPTDSQSLGRALEFSGAPPNHDYASILSTEGDFSALEPGKISVEAWIKTGMSSGTGYIVSKGAAACSAGSYALYMTGGQARFYVQTPGSIFRESPGSGAVKSVTDNNWHHLLGTFDGTTVRLYVDGVQAGAGTSGATESVKYGLATHNNLFFGAYNANSSDCALPFTGTIDNVLVWKNALNASEALRRFQGLDLLPRDDDNDGVPNDLDECPDTPPGTTVNSVGCTVTTLDSDHDGVPDILDRCDNPVGATQPLPVAADGCHDGDGDGVSDEPRDFTGIVRDVCPTGTVGLASRRGCDCNQVRAIIEGDATIAENTGLEEIDPCPADGDYRNHGDYVSCVSRALDYLLEVRVVRFACAEAIQADAAHSDIGKGDD